MTTENSKGMKDVKHAQMTTENSKEMKDVGTSNVSHVSMNPL